MDFVRRAVIVTVMVLCLSSTVFGAVGNAVYYRPPYTPSACYGGRNNGLMVAGVSDALWNGGAACRRRYRVPCIGGANTAPHPCRQGSVVVTAVDYCRSVCHGVLNLSRDAFNSIADLNAGKARVQYDQW